MLAPPGRLAPPPQGNPGSATAPTRDGVQYLCYIGRCGGGGVGEGTWTPAIASFCSPVICRSPPQPHHHDLKHSTHKLIRTLHSPSRVDDASPNDIKQRTLHPITLPCRKRHVSRATTLNILTPFVDILTSKQFKTKLPFIKYILGSCVIPTK